MTRKIDWAYVQELYNSGYSYIDLREKEGIQSQSINLAKKRGDFIPRTKIDAAIVRNNQGGYDKQKRYNWARIQEFHDNDHSWRDITKEFGVAQSAITKAVQRGDLITRNKKQAAVICNNNYPKIMGKEARLRLSERQSLHNSGGRCKWFEVDGQKVQGTWERDFAEKLTKLGIEWRKCAGKKDVVWYTLDGKQKAYTPDFYLPAIDVYFELKGYWWGRDKEKMDAVFTQHPNIKIAVILKKEFEYIMSLAVTASGWSRE